MCCGALGGLLKHQALGSCVLRLGIGLPHDALLAFLLLCANGVWHRLHPSACENCQVLGCHLGVSVARGVGEMGGDL